MNLFDRVLHEFNRRRQRLLDGKVNCIPWGFPKFEQYSPGIEKGKYYLFTANSKVGKTQITDFMCVYNPFRQIKERNLPIKLVIKYFSLEMSKEEKMTQFLCNLIFVMSDMKIIISPQALSSTSNPVDQEVLDFMLKHKDYIDEFLSCVEFIDNIRNPFGIYAYMRDYAMTHGKMHTKKITIKGEEVYVDDYYEENNPEEYVISIIDHAKLLSTENGGTVAQAIGDLSSKYLIQLRNRFYQIPILIQQQAASQESVDNMKADRLRPTLDGLGENKTTQQDANVIFGLFSPIRHRIPEYEGYDIKFFRDNIRFLEILGGRSGGAGTICSLYFNGAVNYFKELPKADDTNAMNVVKQIVINNRNNERK